MSITFMHLTVVTSEPLSAEDKEEARRKIFRHIRAFATAY